MTTRTGSVMVAGRNLGWISARPMLVATIGLGALTVGAAYLSTTAFVVAGIALLGLLGMAALRWPRVMLVVLVLSPPLVDLYAGQRLLPDQVQPVARFFSEGLLLVMTGALAAVGARRGTLVTAVRHPVSLALGVFLLVSIVSAVANAVPLQVAAAGLIFTLDAAVLFYLPRMVDYCHEEARQTLWAVVIVVVLTSLIAIGQAVLSPDLLGVTPITGRSGEGSRFGSLVRDPNILGTLIGMALPLTVFSLARQPRGRRWWLVFAGAVALMLALLLTYSRGSWFGVLFGLGGVALVIDRRALVAFVAVLIVAYATAVVMPKGILTGASFGFDPFATTVNRLQAVAEHRDLRTLFAYNALPIVEAHRWLGVGPGRYGGAAASIYGSPIYDQYGTGELLTEQRTVDSFWLHLGVEAGVLGTSAFLAIIGTALVHPIRALRGATGDRFSVPAGVISATAVVCVATVYTMLLEGNTAAFLFWFVLGIGSMLRPPGTRTGDLAGAATGSAG